MSYAIASVFYGVPATKELALKVWECNEEYSLSQDRPGEGESEDSRVDWGYEVLTEGYGFEAPYSGRGHPEPYYGIDLEGFDECGPIKRLAEYVVAPTTAEREAFEAKLAELPAWLQEAMRPHVDVWVVWGSS